MMTDEEVYREIKLSKNGKKQCKILAQITARSEQDIRDAVQRHADRLIKSGTDYDTVQAVLQKIEDNRGRHPAKAPEAVKDVIEIPEEKTEAAVVETPERESAEPEYNFPKAVGFALTERIRYLNAFIEMKRAEIEQAEKDVKELKEYIMYSVRA